MPTLLRKILRRALRPAVRIYYPLLFGRRFPGAAAGERWVRRLEALGSGGDLPLSGASWEEQYRAGRWACLRSADELARYGVIVALLDRGLDQGAGARTILDVGCGEAILRDLLPGDGYDRYVGLDLSPAAIEKARVGARPQDRLEVADAETWAPAESFDAVVMNECLYYFHDPLAQAHRYFEAARLGGVLLVSMFESPRTRAILRALSARLPAPDRVRVSGARGTWSVAVFRRPTAGSPTAPTPR